MANKSGNTKAARSARPIMPHMVVQEDTTVNYSASNTVRQELYKGLNLRELWLTLEYTIDAATGNAINGGNINPGDEWAAVQRVKILGTNNPIVDLTGSQLKFLNMLVSEGGVINNPLRSGIAAEGSQVVKSTLKIPFWMLRQFVPTDTMLNTLLFNDVSIEVQWGTAASVTSATNASFSVNPTLTVTQYGSQRALAGAGTIRRFNYITRTITGGTNQRIQLGLGEIYDWLIVHAKTSGGTADDPGHIDRFKVQSGSRLYMDVDADVNRDITYQDYGVQGEFGLVDESTTVKQVASEVFDLNAWYPIRFGRDGNLNESLDARNLSQLDLVIDSDAGTTLDLEIITGTLSIPNV